MPTPRLKNRLLVAATMAVAISVVGCQGVTPTSPGAQGEDTLKRGKGGIAEIPTGTARDLRLTTREGAPLNGVVVQIGGKNLVVRNGVVSIPAEAWAVAQKAGELVIIGAGFLPLVLPLDSDLSGAIALTATRELGKPGLVSQAGGTLASAGDVALVTIPGNLLMGGDTSVSVGTYQPATAGLGVAVTIDGPIQAGQLSVSLDLAKMLNGWDGQGTPPASFSAAQTADALAAARILETFRNYDASNDPAGRATMRDTHGITLDNTLLTFPVKLGDASTVDGLARVEVEGLSVLGARLEVTVLSASGAGPAGALSQAVPITAGDVPLSLIQSKLPGYAESPRLQLSNGGTAGTDNGPDAIFPLLSSDAGQVVIRDEAGLTFTPAQLLTNNGGALIANPLGAVTLISDGASRLPTPISAGVVSSNGGSLISNNSGGVVSSNGGSLISNNSSGVVSSNGGSFIGNNAGGLVSNNSGGLISNNSGGLVGNNSSGFKAPTITGYPFFPFEPSQGKYQLLQVGPPVPNVARETATGLIEYLWPGQTRVRAVMANGAPLTEWTRTGGSGEFSIDLPEVTPIVFFLQCELLVRDTDGLPRMAYSMAFAPGKKRTTDVAVDASTTMVATSTLHLLDYIPPEYLRLTGLADSFEKKAKDIADALPDGVDLNALAGGQGSGSGAGKPRGYRLLQNQAPGTSPVPSPSPTIDPKILEAKAQIDALNASLAVIEGRVDVLSGAWDAFNPFKYGNDLGNADKTITEVMAKRISNATSLRRAYDPMYGVAATNGFAPVSYRAINPDSPPETYVVPVP